MRNDCGGPVIEPSPSNIARPQNPIVAVLKSGVAALKSGGRELSSPPAAMEPSKPSKDDAAELKQEHFRLLDLPPELVVRVLEYAVIISSRKRQMTIHTFAAVQPAITRTCRLLRAEGLKIFYPRNYFALTATSSGVRTFWRWLAAVGQEKTSKVEHLFVNLVSGAGRAESPLGLPWGWWLEEMGFFKERAIDPDQTEMLHVRMNGDKVVIFPTIDSNTEFNQYQVSFQRSADEREGWRQYEAFLVGDEVFDSVECLREDWWTPTP